MSDEKPTAKFSATRLWPRAHRYEMHYCGRCPNVHVLYFDEDGLVICEATHSLDQAKAIVKSIKDNANPQ